jgi:hypothetical protein
VVLVVAASLAGSASAEPAQLKPGDRTPVFPVAAVTGPFAGKTVAYVSALQGAPTLIVFVGVDDAALNMLTKVDKLVQRYADKGLKSFGVSMGGVAVADKLKALAELVMTEAEGSLDVLLRKPLDELRPLLLATHGFGPETADSVCSA